LLGVTGLFLGLRLWLICSIQVPLEGRLEYLMDWLGLPVSLSSLTWMLTFGIGAFTAWPLVKKFLFFITGIPWFCPNAREWLLLLILPASTFLPATVQTICPIREVEPSSADWFYPDAHPETGKPHGRIGFLREADGSWKFYNIPVFIRPADAAAVQRVTPEVRQQWQADPQRKQQEESRQRREAAELAEREAKLKLQRDHESRMAAARLEMQRIEAERVQSENAKVEAAKARQQAEQARQQAAAAEKARQEAESARQRLQAAEDLREQQELATWIESKKRPAMGSSTQSAQLAGQAFPIQRGLWKNIHVRGDRVEVWCDGPVSLGADQSPPRTYPGGAWVRFEQGPGTIHAAPAGSGSTRVVVRKL